MTIKLKTVKVTNPKNVLVQVPKLAVELLQLDKGDELEVVISDDAKSIIVRKAENVGGIGKI
jgi:bifunctional DNA-binding transcriptional regulator/antitoxin component of YhaV-PrlF toxin-antitoxin module